MFHVPAHKNTTDPAGQVSIASAPAPDFRFLDAGSIVLLRPVSEAAITWCDERFSPESPRHGRGYAIEPRYFVDIADDIDTAGFVVSNQY